MKIAINTQTQAQFDALMQYFEDREINASGGKRPSKFSFMDYYWESTVVQIGFYGKGFTFSNFKLTKDKHSDFVIIPFTSFAEAAGIKFEEPKPAKKMTVAEIAKELGYQVEIIEG